MVLVVVFQGDIMRIMVSGSLFFYRVVACVSSGVGHGFSQFIYWIVAHPNRKSALQYKQVKGRV